MVVVEPLLVVMFRGIHDRVLQHFNAFFSRLNQGLEEREKGWLLSENRIESIHHTLIHTQTHTHTYRCKTLIRIEKSIKCMREINSKRGEEIVRVFLIENSLKMICMKRKWGKEKKKKKSWNWNIDWKIISYSTHTHKH